MVTKEMWTHIHTRTHAHAHTHTRKHTHTHTNTHPERLPPKASAVSSADFAFLYASSGAFAEAAAWAALKACVE